jgi:hypothetical protein
VEIIKKGILLKMAYKTRKKKNYSFLEMVLYPSEVIEEAFREERRGKKGKQAYKLWASEEQILTGVAEKGAWYVEPKNFVGRKLYEKLVTDGYIKIDEFGRPSITAKGTKYLKTWKIKWKKQPAPKFEEPKYKQEKELIEKAGEEFSEKPTVLEKERKKEIRPTAERLVEEA